MSAPLSFEKIHACGNDFLLLQVSPDPDRIAALCDRHHGLGADGLMVWRREGDTVHMDHYDPDGSRSLCLNGTRAALGCLAAQNLIPTQGEATCEGRPFPYHIAGARVTLRLPLVPYHPHSWKGPDGALDGFYCDVGNPHFVLVGGLSPEQFPATAPLIRGDRRAFPQGTNVHLVWPTGDGRRRIRSFERGVEALTLACGSGMYAAALIALGEEHLTRILFQPDGQGSVTFCKEGDHLTLTGETVWVASGETRC